MLHFAHRTAPDQKYTDLNPDLVSWPARVRLAAENGYFEFRGSQIELELSELRQTYTIEGGDEIALFNGPPVSNPSIQTPLWSGTVDPAKITRDEITHRLSFRVLQHGSLLNTIFAGLDDWTLDSGSQLETIPGRPYRYKGTADQWLRVANDDSTFKENIIESENETVYITPTAKDALTDSLYQSKFLKKVYHYHTGHRTLGGVEYPYPQRYADPGGDSGPLTIWTGAFRPHYRPDFDRPASEWPEEDGAIITQAGAYLRNQKPVLDFYRQDIPEILADLVNQFNRTARFPLAFDPDSDCTIISPAVEAEIEILKRRPDVAFIDLRVRLSKLFALVNFKDDPPRARQEMRFNLYMIENESAATPLLEDAHGLRSNCWPTFADGLRFRRNFADPASSTIILYSLALSEPDGGPRSFIVFSYNFTAGSPSDIRGPFAWPILEPLGDFPDSNILNRSANFVSSTTGQAYIRESAGAGPVLPPEAEPATQETSNNRTFRTQQGGLTVTGALFDRVAIDAEDARISTLISDLAKLTNSRWWITPDRRLKFMSRQLTGPQRAVPSYSLRRPARTFTRSFEQESPPAISQNLVVPQNYQQALDQWYRDEILPNSATGRDLAVTLSDLSEVALHDHLLVDGNNSPSAVTTIDIVGDNTLEITTETPIVPAP